MDQPVNISCLTMAAGIHVHAPQVKKRHLPIHHISKSLVELMRRKLKKLGWPSSLDAQEGPSVPDAHSLAQTRRFLLNSDMLGTLTHLNQKFPSLPLACFVPIEPDTGFISSLKSTRLASSGRWNP